MSDADLRRLERRANIDLDARRRLERERDRIEGRGLDMETGKGLEAMAEMVHQMARAPKEYSPLDLLRGIWYAMTSWQRR